MNDNTTLLDIAVGGGKYTNVWKNRQWTWPDFARRLSEAEKTGETMAEYAAMSKEDKGNAKDVGGFVGGFLKGGVRKKNSVLYRQVACLDADEVPGNIDFPALVAEKFPHTEYVIYSTHSHTKEKPRYRVVFPLLRRMAWAEYEHMIPLLNSVIGAAYFDKGVKDVTRFMYFPSTCADGEFVFVESHGDWLDPDAVLGGTTLFNAPAPELEAARKAIDREVKHRESTGGRMEDPRAKDSIVGLFCRAYDIHAAIATYLPHVYMQVDGRPDRYTYREGAGAAGLAVYDNGQFAFSFHGTDPAGAREWNAFDLVRLHLFGDEPDEGYESPAEKPSYKEMAKLANTDKKVAAQRAKELRESFGDAETDEPVTSDDTPPDADAKTGPEWTEKLRFNKDGKLTATVPNLLLVFRNDPRLKAAFGMDLFARREALLRDLPWRKKNSDRGEFWCDYDEACLRNYLAVTYGDVKGADRIRDVFQQVAGENEFHPVRDFLNSLPPWDEIPRVEVVLVRWLNAEDTPYVRAASRLWFKGAVARVMQPGAKFDYSLILKGEQGLGKSSLLARLGGKWFTDSVASIEGKDPLEQLQGKWIIEFGEMQAGKKAENAAIKAFLTRTEDFFRKSYGRYAENFPRQCVFAGTTNEDVFLKDTTGARRFLIIKCGDVAKNVYAELGDDEVRQIWAEALACYRQDPVLTLPPDIEKEAKRVQLEATEGDEMRGIVEDFLDTPRPAGWDAMSTTARVSWLEEEKFPKPDIPHTPGTERCNEVCVLDIWCECLGYSRERLNNFDSQRISGILRMLGWRVGQRKYTRLYGRQRIYERP